MAPRLLHTLRGTLVDGIDTIRNIELLQFTDQDLFLNVAATGQPAISDTTPTQGATLTASDRDAGQRQWHACSRRDQLSMAGSKRNRFLNRHRFRAIWATFIPQQAHVGLTVPV